MILEDKFFNSFNEDLKIVSYCPVCNHRHNPVKAQVLADKNGAHLIYVKCSHCQSAVLAVVSVGNLGVTSVGLVTDLSSDDITKFKNSRPINCDDVIEVHKRLTQDKVLIDQLN